MGRTIRKNIRKGGKPGIVIADLFQFTRECQINHSHLELLTSFK